MNNSKQFDFVVYGASGFTGKLVIEYLVSQYGDDKNISWALAGRNIEKLQSIKGFFTNMVSSRLGLVDNKET